MNTSDKYTEAIINCMKDASPICRRKIYEIWEAEIFSRSAELELYLKKIYNKMEFSDNS